MAETTSHELNMQEVHFKKIKKRQKTVEARLMKGIKYESMKVGDELIFKYDDQKIKSKIVGLEMYNSFREMLECEGYDKVGMKSIDQGVQIYEEIYYDWKEGDSNEVIEEKKYNRCFKILAIRIQI